MAIDTRKKVDALLAKFADELMKVFSGAIISAVEGARGDSVPAARARPSTRGRAAGKTRRGPKSSPAEVKALGERIVEALRKAGKELSAADLEAQLKTSHGPFQYALGKLKASGDVKQHGERRMARYSVGEGKAEKGTRARKASKPAKARGRTRKAAKTSEATSAAAS